MNYLAGKSKPVDIRTFKIVLLGNYSVGKSTFAARFHGKELLKPESTIGASFSAYKHKINDNYITFNIWDTAGQERYRSLTKIYFRGVHICILMYDMTDLNSLQEIKDNWLPEFIGTEYVKNQVMEGGVVKVYLVGNKLDLFQKEKKSKTYESQRKGMITEIKSQYPSIDNFEISALELTNVKKFIDKIIENSIDQLSENEKKGIKKPTTYIENPEFHLNPMIKPVGEWRKMGCCSLL